MNTKPVFFLLGFGLVAGPGWAIWAEGPSQFSLQVEKDKVELFAGKDLITRYHTGPQIAKPYFWPMNGPHGIPLTRAWPMKPAVQGESTDHPHQKSAWFTHGDVIPEGMSIKKRSKDVEGIDFWAEAPGHGKIVCTYTGQPKSARDHIQLDTKNEWQTAEGAKILDENRTLHFYDFGETQLIVVSIDLHATVTAIRFGDTKEGSFGIRINDQIRAQKGLGQIENAQGKVGEKACWGQISPWCDYSGPINGKVVGLAILDDPKNPYPACWHSRGYGLMAANPFGRAKSGFPAMKGRTDLVRIEKGQHLRLRYGLLLHPGNAKEGRVQEFFQRFVKLRG